MDPKKITAITSITGARGSNTSIGGNTGTNGTWNVTAGPYTSGIDTGNVMWTATPNTVWTTNTADWTIGPTPQAGTMELRGDNADIVVNGRSLMNAIDALEQRLNILVPNPELEKEWDDLRELGDRYRELERQCKEKGDMWAKLKEIKK
jgi:hypothetical protein